MCQWIKEASSARRVEFFNEVTMRNAFQALGHSRKFWLTVFALVQTIVFQFFPAFPKEVWMSIDALVIVLVSAIAYEDGNAPTL